MTTQTAPRMAYPFPRFCRVHGWLLSRGGAVRVYELKITLGRPNGEQFRRWVAAARAVVIRAEWPGEGELDVIPYAHAVRVVAAAKAEQHRRRGREPP